MNRPAEQRYRRRRRAAQRRRRRSVLTLAIALLLPAQAIAAEASLYVGAGFGATQGEALTARVNGRHASLWVGHYAPDEPEENTFLAVSWDFRFFRDLLEVSPGVAYVDRASGPNLVEPWNAFLGVHAVFARSARCKLGIGVIHLSRPFRGDNGDNAAHFGGGCRF